jgi:hydroxyacylglutathione hydrolase
MDKKGEEMQKTIKTLRLPLPLGMGSVNCYLIESEKGFALIDSGGSYSRKALEKELEGAGCKPGSLRLIVLTHGDFDHTGNAAYLRNAFGGKILMHPEDLCMVEQKDMFANRKKPNALIRMLLPVFSGFGKAEQFEPDHLVKDGEDLVELGMEAKVVAIPGHSKGSIGILTREGNFFCGDLLVSTAKPELNSMIDDPATAKTSLQRLSSLGVQMVYPGHGNAFTLQEVVDEPTLDSG